MRLGFLGTCLSLLLAACGDQPSSAPPAEGTDAGSQAEAEHDRSPSRAKALQVNGPKRGADLLRSVEGSPEQPAAID
ncbi:MAG: hypothetical protein OEV40_11205 [Acidimicrobiia bacterium]|nr:hypothetical protein [Acidimicrobiia bacterium]